MPVRTLRPRSLSLAIHAAAMTLALAGAAPRPACRRGARRQLGAQL